MIENGGFWNPLTPFTLSLFIYIHGYLLYRETLPTANLLKVPPFKRRKTDTLNWRETKITYHNLNGRSRWSKEVKLMDWQHNYMLPNISGCSVSLILVENEVINIKIQTLKPENGWSSKNEIEQEIQHLCLMMSTACCSVWRLLSDIKPKKEPTRKDKSSFLNPTASYLCSITQTSLPIWGRHMWSFYGHQDAESLRLRR